MRMPVPLFIASRNLAYRRTRSLVTILAVALGTSVVAATFATNRAIDDGLRASARALAGDADLVIDSLEPGGLPQEVVTAIRRLPDVQLATPQVQRRTFFRTPRGRGFVEVIGIDPEQ